MSFAKPARCSSCLLLLALFGRGVPALGGVMLPDAHSQNYVKAGGEIESRGDLFTSGVSQTTSNPVLDDGTILDFTASASASSGGSASTLLRASSRSYGGEGDPETQLMGVPGIAEAEAQWRDRITLRSLRDPPTSLTIRMRFSGFLSAIEDQIDGVYSNAHARAWLGSGFNFTSFRSGTSASYGYAAYHPAHGLMVDGLDEAAGFGSSVNGTFSAIIPYNRVTEDYSFHTGIYTYSFAHNGSAIANFSNTLAIDAIFDDQGQQLTDADLQFASGLQMQTATVPEPSSLTIIGFGGFTLLLRRRNRVRR